MKQLILLVLLITSSLNIAASEKVTVCAKYRKEYGWSEGYKVEASLMTGSELNSATHSFNYTGFSKYVVIFWSEEQVSIIELSMPYLNAIGTDGEDQQGRKWEIAKTNFCM